MPDNLTLYNPYGFINDYIAMVVGMLLCAAAGAVILPPNAGWMLRRLEAELRYLMVFAVSGDARRLASRFESRARDIVHHAYGLAAAQPRVQRELMRWMLAVLEIGHGVIEIRAEQEALFVHPAYASDQPWRQAIRAMGRALIRLFIQPGRAIVPGPWARWSRRSRPCATPTNPSPDISILRCCVGCRVICISSAAVCSILVRPWRCRLIPLD